MSRLSKWDRFYILQRDNFKCQYCGAKGLDVELEVDHVVPVSKGGTNDHRNLVTACYKCNRGKRDNINLIHCGTFVGQRILNYYGINKPVFAYLSVPLITILKDNNII